MKLTINNINTGFTFTDSKYRMQGYDDSLGIKSYIHNDRFIGYVSTIDTIQYYI